MDNLTQRLSALSDREAVQAASYVTEWMQQQLREERKLPPEFESQFTDDEAADMLVDVFRDVAGPLNQARLSAAECERAQIARSFLSALSQDERYAAVVHEAVEQLVYKAEPITTMAIAAGIVFLLTLEFDFEYTDVDGKRKLRWRLSRKASPIELVGKVLGLGSSPHP